MIITEGDKRLLQAGTFRTLSHDDWSVSVEVYGLDEKTGDTITWRVALSNGEINYLVRYCASHGLQHLLDPRGLSVKPGR